LGKILQVSYLRAAGGLAATVLEALRSPTLLRVIWFTFWQATVSTLLTLAIGLPGAYLLARYDFRGKSTLQALFGIPFVMPTLVVAAAFYSMIGPTGWINLGLMSAYGLDTPPVNITNTIIAILLAHVFYNTTIVLRIVGDFWSHLDSRLVLAARSLGASRWEAFRRISAPLLTPAILAAALLIFIFDFTSFGVILVLGGPRFATLEVEIYYQTISLFNLPLAATLSIIQLVCTISMTVIYTRLSARLSQPLNIQSSQVKRQKLTTWKEKLMAGIILVMLFVLLTAPLIGLAARSFTRIDLERGQRGEPDRGLTLDYYRELGMNRRSSLFYVPPITAIGISIAYAGLTVLVSLLVGLPAAWTLARDKNSLLNRILDPVLMLPLGTSAVTLGLGFIVALNRPPLDLRASPLLIPIAHSLVAFPFVVRSLTPALRSIRPRLRHAASVLGASPGRIIRHIDIPLVGRAVLVAATFAFTISLGEFGATVLIARPEYPTIPLVIYRYISQPGAINYGQALALSTILMVVAASSMIAIERLRIADVGEF
jgi:thiamine transport system permease protein